MTERTPADPWAKGDYHQVVGQHLEPVAATLVQAAGAAPDVSLLDVGCGTGNAALIASQAGAHVTGLDLSPGLLRQARERLRRADGSAHLVHGDAMALPFADARFDAVVSNFAHVFAPDPETATREMVRVVRPGGTIAYTGWRQDGASGPMVAAVHPHLDSRPDLEDMFRGFRWSEAQHVRGALGSSVTVAERLGTVRFPSADADAFMQEHTQASPGMIALLAPFSDRPDERAALVHDMTEALAPFHRNGAMEMTYAMIVVRRND